MYNILVSKPIHNFNLLLGGNNMKATTLTHSTFEMMYYETRGVYCNPAEKFLSYTEFKKIFEPALSRGCNINELATAIYNKAIDNGATEEAALHAALFVFSFTAGKQAAKKWFDGLVAKQSENDKPDDNTDNSNPENDKPDDNNSDHNSGSADQPENDNSENDKPDDSNSDHNSGSAEQPENDNSEVKEELKLFGRDLEIYLNTYAMFDATKNGAFMPIINEYRINCIDRARQLKKKRTSKENTELVDAVIAALKDAESGAKALLKLCECFIEDTFDMTNEEQRTKVLEILKDYLPKPKPEEDPKDPDPTGPSDSGAVISEPVEEPIEEIFETVEVVETPMVANNITIEERFRGLKGYMDDLWTTDPHSPEVVYKARCIMAQMCSIAADIEKKPALDVNATERYIWKYICKLSDIVEDINNSKNYSNFHRVLPASYISFTEANNKDQAIDSMTTIRCNTTASDSASALNQIELPTDILNRMLEQPTPSKKGTSKHPNVPEAIEKDGKIPTDTDLAGIFELYVAMAGPINGYCGHLHRHHLNMMLNYIMNDMDGVASQMAEAGAKKPIKLVEVPVDKYTTDRNRFDVVFEAEANTENEPVVLFYHMEPTFDIKENKWSNDLLVKPYKECVLAADALARRQAQEEAKQKAEAEKKAKKNGKSNKQSKSKKKEEQVAPQPQAMTATA